MGAVLTAVGVACMGAFAFGYHLGVVNGPLEAIAKELGFLGNQALSGLVRSIDLELALLVSGTAHQQKSTAVDRRSGLHEGA
jgi:hypothetical protein